MPLAKTHLDEMVNYPRMVLKKLYNNPEFVSLLVNIPNADINDETVEEIWEKCVFDYDYVDGIIQDPQSFCCIDTEVETRSPTIKNIYITILIGVHHNMMSLSKSGFKGIAGNRRDNLIRQLDYSLRDNGDFGIGGLELVGKVRPVTISGAGNNFACKVINYKVPNFGKEQLIINDI